MPKGVFKPLTQGYFKAARYYPCDPMTDTEDNL